MIGIVCFAVAELTGRLVFYFVTGEWFSTREFTLQLDIARSETGTAATPAVDSLQQVTAFNFPEIIHPYLGFVQKQEHSESRVDKYGFPLNFGGPIRLKNEADCVIGIFGGSFAQGIATHRNSLINTLAPLQKNVVVINTAMGGYKQPQQLLTLCYLLSLGAEFDVVVNLDGFNEVALPFAENIPKGVFPIFPRNWYFRVLSEPPEDLLLLSGEMQYIRRERNKLLQSAESGSGKWSICRYSIWRMRDRRFSERLNLLQLAILGLNADRNSNESVSGPPYNREDTAVISNALAEHWANCSRLMDEICRAHGIRYYHFLQPNQYVEGTRLMTPSEKAVAFDPKHPYRQGVVDGYPLLMESGKKLSKAGVAFHDLTMIFSETPDPVYQDTCCHPGPAGYEIVGAAIGEFIRDDILRQGSNAGSDVKTGVFPAQERSSENIHKMMNTDGQGKVIPPKIDRKNRFRITKELSVR